tara:strand:- start:2644 stop:4002 length:1359 start_codon:yes stop_codon:yes gene_type:complete
VKDNITVHKREEIKKALLLALQKIEKISSDKDERGFIFSVDNTPLVSRSILTALKIMKGESRLENLILSMIREACYEAEKKSAISSEVLFHMLRDLMESSLNEFNIIDFNEQVASLLEIFHKSSERAKLTDFKKILKWNFNPQMQSIIIEAIKKAGLEGTVAIEFSEVNQPAIDVTSGYYFQCTPDVNVLSSMKKHTWEFSDAKVLVVDGLIEKVSEIDNILNHCVDSKAPLVICARGFSYDVISTIVLNNQRGVLNVMCIGIPIEESNPNKLVDIAVCSGSDVISSLKGELISSVDPESLPIVDSFHASMGKIKIVNLSQKDSVRYHVDRLKESREKNENDLAYLDSRIKSLTGRTVRIILPRKDEASNVLMTEKIDSVLRTMKSLIAFGKINFSSLKSLIKKEETFLTNSTIKKLSRIPVIPSSSISLGLRDAKVFSKLLTDTHNAVLFN